MFRRLEPSVFQVLKGEAGDWDPVSLLQLFRSHGRYLATYYHPYLRPL
jgi:hypothetical protein